MVVQSRARQLMLTVPLSVAEIYSVARFSSHHEAACKQPGHSLILLTGIRMRGKLCSAVKTGGYRLSKTLLHPLTCTG